MWADIDAYPGMPASENDFFVEKTKEDFDYAIKSIKSVSAYLINGMVYGWEFSYTPYDKTRGVKEYFEVKEINPVEEIKSRIEYSSPWIDNNVLNCWCDFTRSEYEIQNYYRWSSIHNAVIQGIGYGSVKDGFEGIKIAAEEALKKAVRSHYRSIIKNKPKEIRGKVLIREEPLIGVDSGRYVINLDFFLECDKIIEYKVF